MNKVAARHDGRDMRAIILVTWDQYKLWFDLGRSYGKQSKSSAMCALTIYE